MFDLSRLKRINPIQPEPISLEQLLSYYSQFVVGEEQLLLQSTFSILGNQSFGILGKSGSGKTHVLDTVINLFPHYTFDLSSELAPFYDVQFKKSDWIYISELQRAGKTTKEILKNIADGKNISRTITQGKSKTALQIPAKQVCFTLATENNYKIDPELKRRFLILRTDESEEQTQRILTQQPRKNSSPNPRRYLNHCLSLPVYNPHTDFLLQDLPLTLEMRSFFPKLKKLVEGYTRFNHKERDCENKDYISTIEDNKFIKNLCKFGFIS